VTLRVLTAAAALALVVIAGREPDRSVELTAVTGALSTSGHGSAILSAPNLQPGDSVTATATVRNRGEGRRRLFLESSTPRGGALGAALELKVTDARTGASVAVGTPAAVAGCHALGRLPAGAARTYRFSVTLPRSAGNEVAGSSVTVDERWHASDCRRHVAAAPAPRLVISHRRVLLRRGRVRLVLRCAGLAGSSCRGRLWLWPTALASRRTAAARGRTSRYDVPAGVSRALLVPLPRAARDRVRRRGRAVVRLHPQRMLLTVVSPRSR